MLKFLASSLTMCPSLMVNTFRLFSCLQLCMDIAPAGDSSELAQKNLSRKEIFVQFVQKKMENTFTLQQFIYLWVLFPVEKRQGQRYEHKNQGCFVLHHVFALLTNKFLKDCSVLMNSLRCRHVQTLQSISFLLWCTPPNNSRCHFICLGNKLLWSIEKFHRHNP